MNAAEIRSDLFKKIETMNIAQLKEFHGVLQNYFNNGDLQHEWAALTDQQRSKIDRGIAQADAGRVKPLEEVAARLRKKYGANG